MAFDTEAYYDELSVGSALYSGTSGPQDVSVAAGTFIYFSSDISTRDWGFEICADTSASDDDSSSSDSSNSTSSESDDEASTSLKTSSDSSFLSTTTIEIFAPMFGLTSFIPCAISYCRKRGLSQVNPNDSAPSNSALMMVAFAGSNSPQGHAAPVSTEAVQPPQTYVVPAQVTTPQNQDDNVYVVSAVVV